MFVSVVARLLRGSVAHPVPVAKLAQMDIGFSAYGDTRVPFHFRCIILENPPFSGTRFYRFWIRHQFSLVWPFHISTKSTNEDVDGKRAGKQSF